MPSLPALDDDDSEGDKEIMPAIRRVMAYSNLNYHEVLQLDNDVFLLMNKNYQVDEWNKTEDGRDYLEKCKRLNTTSIDRKAFRKKANA